MLHLVDGTAEDPVADYHTIQQELIAYGQGLASKPQMLAINKIDSLLEEDVDKLAAELSLATGEKVWRISAVSKEGTDELLSAIWALLEEVNEAIAAEESRAAQALIEFNTPTLRSTP